MRHLIRRASLALVLSLALLATAGVGVASAHMAIASRTPAAGSKVKNTFTKVSLTFVGQPKKGTLKVTNAAGTKVSIGLGGVDPRNVKRLVVSVKSGLAVGKYTVRWTAVASDGHNVNGTWSFNIIK